MSLTKHLRRRGFKGDIRTDASSRLVHATDNSIYHVTPQAVVAPHSTADVAALMATINSPKHASTATHVMARGGGTGTNGQSLGNGIAIDFSRHMNRVLEINTQEHWVRVEPGVVLDTLNAALKPHGFYFGPSVAPSSRATIGGMIATDACGKGSVVHGRTSQHILELEWVSATGDIHRTVSPGNNAPHAGIPDQAGDDGNTQTPQVKHGDELQLTANDPLSPIQIETKLINLLTPIHSIVSAQFPKISRFVSGYNIPHALTENHKLNINALIAGSEGTLALVTQARLKIQPIPKRIQVLVLGYLSFQSAITDGVILAKHHPYAIETMDYSLITVSKGDARYKEIITFAPELRDKKVKAISIIEFKGDDPSAIQLQLNEAKLESAAIAYYDTTNPEKQSLFWQWRARAVGLAGNTGTAASAIPFVEDCAVPPEHLADFVKDTQTLLMRYDLSAAFYGHLDAGCIHMRPICDLQYEDNQEKILPFTQEMVKLSGKYGGILWGEHGRGYRSGVAPQVFGSQIYGVMQAIKEVFDPTNILNPGKIATPLSTNVPLKQPNDDLRAKRDVAIPDGIQAQFLGTIACNGNGQCFQVNHEATMCPSYKVTLDRIHSPKGRATLIREWLRENSLTRNSILLPNTNSWFITKCVRTIARIGGRKNRHHDLFNALDKCLSCNACTHQCPVHVNIPAYKSQFLHMYYSRYLRPIKDHLLSNVEWAAIGFTAAPRFWNTLTHNPVSKLVLRGFGLKDLPKLSVPSTSTQLKKCPEFENVRSVDSLSKLLRFKPTQHTLFFAIDAFTFSYDAPTLIHTLRVLVGLKYEPVILPFSASGKAKHVRGFKDSYEADVISASEILQAAHTLKRPITGIEPSVVGQWSNDYQKVLKAYSKGNERLFPKVGKERRIETVIWNALCDSKGKPRKHPFKSLSMNKLQNLPTYHLFLHCHEQSESPETGLQWQRIFSAFGIELIIEKVGCCGMAGGFGHETRHAADSKGIYALSWESKIKTLNPDQILATGFSCRSQIKRFSSKSPQHPVSVLARFFSR
ncbi:MAG: FAD-binding and (Fe-S)-binding domain-containing protein [bacterium]|nr:FAD-binding and (Fe-S)-binding domain-containing protein [bacterium]